MAACGSLQHIFDTLLPENPTLIESLSWNQIKPVKPLDQPSSLTEIFGELHFKESPISSSSSSSIETNHTKLYQKVEDYTITNQTPPSSPPSASVSSSTSITNHTNNRHKSSDSFSSLSSESLQLCTEGLGFESSDDVEELKIGMSGFCWQSDEKEGVKKHAVPSSEEEEDSYGECRRASRIIERWYPPPISCIGRSGKPWVCFKSYRSNGRFVLKEIRIPRHEFLHAYREDGRLKLQFVQPDDEFTEEEDEDHYDDEEEEEEEDVGFMEEEEENMAKENDCCVKDMKNDEEK